MGGVGASEGRRTVLRPIPCIAQPVHPGFDKYGFQPIESRQVFGVCCSKAFFFGGSRSRWDGRHVRRGKRLLEDMLARVRAFFFLYQARA
ncbi:BQ5605_C013g07066 [Microbotryum silenes-dioicae]|uniref:BQ5605_C013g07066 protein n=1 Tax=Microbotryum silenes-dioicae TaxID=796604 RepID=A0A2X0MK65_9BASI|nr:BQ5605_C013g07066 [Microbotryum silenes-dioicae]